MSLPIDNSTQLPGGTFTSGAPSYDNIKEWSINNTSNLYNTSLIGNVGIGTSVFNGYKLNINGSLNSTSLYQSGTQIDFSSYATNTNLTNNYYNKLSTDSLLNAKQNTLTAGTSLLGDGANITNLTYGNITGKPSYFPIDPAIYYNQTQINNISNTIIQNNSNFTLGTSNILRTLINTNLSDSSNYAFNISNILTIRDGTKQDTLTATTNLLGVGTSITAIDYNKVSVNKPTNFQADWNTTIINKPSTFPVDTTIYYNKSEVNTLIGNTSNYAFNISNVIIANNSNFTLGTSNILRTLINTNLSSSSNYASNVSNVIIANNSNFTLGTSNILRNLINTNLSDSSNYASNISNVIIANNSNFTLGTSNIITTNINTNYLKLAGGNMTGQLNISTSTIDNQITLTTTAINNFCSIKLKNNSTNYGYVGIGATALTGGGYYVNNLFLEATNSLIFNTGGQTSATANSPVMILNNSGNLGIGTTNPTSKLYVNGNSAFKGLLNIHNGSPYAVANNYMAAGSLIIGDTQSNYGTAINWTASTAGLLMECADYTEIVVHDNATRLASLIYYDGPNNNITIGRNKGWNAISSVNTFGNLISSGYIYAGGTTTGIRINGNDYGNTFYQDANLINGNAANIGFTLRGTNTFNFYSLSTTGGGYTNILSMNTSGISLFSQLIYNYLFNNTGNAHNSTSDFNSITHFGYRFIQGNTNGPSGIDNLYTQSYSWYIGIGSDYPASGANSYGAQFALARNTSYPVLSVRFKENNVWGGWTGITAERVRLKTDQWNYSTEGNQRIYCGTNSTTYYQGYGNSDYSINHDFRNHDGSSKFVLYYGGATNAGARIYGQLTCGFYTIANTNRDLVGVNIENTNTGNYNNTTLYVIQGTFTGFHRVFTEDELFNINEPQIFKDNYEGRIVISTGKIATDTNETNKEWEIKYDKEGITIEDALPKIELSRNKKDKRVFGILGDKRRSNSRPERLIVNSVGEGAIWVCNSNGNIENGDYITSSDYLGYGEKQDEIYLCNYTVAKATMDCDFQLDSPLYNCIEIDDLDVNGNKLRIAFIACTYHCG